MREYIEEYLSFTDFGITTMVFFEIVTFIGITGIVSVWMLWMWPRSREGCRMYTYGKCSYGLSSSDADRQNLKIWKEEGEDKSKEEDCLGNESKKEE